MIANNEPVSAPLRRALVLHPFLLAAYPVVYLWAHNLREGVAVRDVVVPLAIAIGAATLLTLAGTLVQFNPALLDDPSGINVDGYGAGWLFTMRADPAMLMTAEEYHQFLSDNWEKTQRLIKGKINEE